MQILVYKQVQKISQLLKYKIHLLAIAYPIQEDNQGLTMLDNSVYEDGRINQQKILLEQFRQISGINRQIVAR